MKHQTLEVLATPHILIFAHEHHLQSDSPLKSSYKLSHFSCSHHQTYSSYPSAMWPCELTGSNSAPATRAGRSRRISCPNSPEDVTSVTTAAASRFPSALGFQSNQSDRYQNRPLLWGFIELYHFFTTSPVNIKDFRMLKTVACHFRHFNAAEAVNCNRISSLGHNLHKLIHLYTLCSRAIYWIMMLYKQAIKSTICPLKRRQASDRLCLDFDVV